MAEATFRHGSPTMVDYTPGAGNVSAGEVVLIGNLAGASCGVAHTDIENTKLGALAIGGGIYDVINLDNAATGAPVWWATTNKVTTNSTNTALFGFIVASGGGGANSTCRALHHPFEDAG